MSICFDCTSTTPIAEGGEGIIYELNGQLAKIYKSCVNMASKEKKVKLLMQKLMSNSLPPQVVAPKDTIVDRNGNFTGYIMDKVEGEDFKRLANKKFISANAITTKDILKMLVNAQTVINALHKNNIFIGDLNDQNILFDKQFNIYFIDCDSWSIENERCEVAMDLFKDPMLSGNCFNASTDTYAFAVLAWKTLTRIHPFGGTMTPDMNLLERMQNRISVIDNPDVTIPKTIKTWRNLSPALTNALKNIFETDCRVLGNELSEMLSNLKFCNIDQEYYYGKYSACPICDANAKVMTKAVSQGVMRGLTVFALLDASKLKTVLNENAYLDKNDYVVDIHSGNKTAYQYGAKYYFTSDGYVIKDLNDEFVVYSEKEYHISKKYKSSIIVKNNHIYYISAQNSFTDMTVLKQGNSIKHLCKCSNTAYFEISSNHYCIINYYFGKIIVNTDGKNIEIPYVSDIINYGIHFDDISQKWLIILEDSKGEFVTYVILNGIIDFMSDKVRYNCPLSSVCISNSVLFLPTDGKIRGFAYQKAAYKDFECDIVNNDSRLIKHRNKFTIINDENMYSLE